MRPAVLQEGRASTNQMEVTTREASAVTEEKTEVSTGCEADEALEARKHTLSAAHVLVSFGTASMKDGMAYRQS